MKNKTDQILLALFEIGAFALVAIGLRSFSRTLPGDRVRSGLCVHLVL